MESYLYTPKENHDLPLLSWWNELVGSGDLQRVFGASMQSLTSFMRLFSEPSTTLVYGADDRTWTRAAWTVPIASAGAWSCWLRDDQRHKPSSLVFLLRSLRVGFTLYPTLLTLTRDYAVINEAQRVGFSLLGTIPGIFDGETAYVAYLSREDFDRHVEDNKLEKVIHGKPRKD